MFGDPADIIKEWIWDELEKILNREPTTEDFEKVVQELPEFVSREDIRRIVARLFGKDPRCADLRQNTRQLT